MKRMQSAYLTVQLTGQTGSLERLLGRIRRRGFQIENMMVASSGFLGDYRIDMRLTGDRSFESLTKQLANLYEVTSIALHVAAESVVAPARATA